MPFLSKIFSLYTTSVLATGLLLVGCQARESSQAEPPRTASATAARTPETAGSNVAQLTFHADSLRDCSKPRPQRVPAYDSCSNISVVWATVAGKPAINEHLRSHLLTWATADSVRKPLPASMHTALQQALNASPGFAEKHFKVSVVQNEQGLLTLQNAWFYDGAGAHSNEGVMYYNYDLAHDQLLTLSALLIPGYQPRLHALAKKAFYQQHPQASMLDAPDRFRLTTNFLITNEGLRFHYNAGQVGAFAAGPQELLLPWSQLHSLLRPGTVVARLAGVR